MSLLKLGSQVDEAAQGIGQAQARDRLGVELRKRSTGSVSADAGLIGEDGFDAQMRQTEVSRLKIRTQAPSLPFAHTAEAEPA